MRRFDVYTKITAATEAAVSARRPMVGKATSLTRGAPPVKEFNPRFEDGYTKGRDYDPDRERAEQRKLKRQVSKEKRGARV